MILSAAFTILFAISGIGISEVVFAKHKFTNRLWLGLVLGLLMLTWLPSLLALAIGFTRTAQILAAALATLALGTSVLILALRKKRGVTRSYRIGNPWVLLLWAVPVLVLCGYLLHTHVLNPHADGSLWVGQVTYGDLAMHLGFITSIAEQTVFPPQYSIFPGHALNYPFLCETSGASLYLLGASVRQAYIISALYAFVTVILGVYLFFEQWLKRPSRAFFASLLFFFGGGFGFFYFFDLSKTGGLLSSAIGTYGQTVSESLLDGFYLTPTNIPALGLRWVNPIVDMLIPQRATLFGWAFLFPCLYLLHGFAFEKQKHNVIPLAVIAGLLPMIHTHSFLALGVVSAVYCVIDLISVRFEKNRLFAWVFYAAIACLLAAPQLFLFTFRQTSESGMVRIHLNWANEADSYLWFYIKNLGLIFLLMPFAFLLLSKKDRKMYAGAAVLWLLAEFVAFQPNNYDNNKLLFVWFAFTCAIVTKLLFVLWHKAWIAIRKRSSRTDRRFSYRICTSVLLTFLLLYFFGKLAFDSRDGFLMRPGTAGTVFFVSLLVLVFCIFDIHASRKSAQLAASIVPIVLSLGLTVSIFLIWLKQYRRTAWTLPKWLAAAAAILCLLSMIVYVLMQLREQTDGKRLPKFTGAAPAMAAAACLLFVSLTASSAMTIIRECKSEYQVYTKDEVELSDKIRNVSAPDDVILANSYHWNPVTPLTGRSIVTGTGTYLYYHGIDTSEREADVADMFEYPEENADLFRKYGVKYILISNAERGNYDIDYAYFNAHAKIAAQTNAGVLLELDP